MSLAPCREWLALNPGGWCTMLSEDQAYWESLGISTAEELDRDLAISEHSDISKEVYGVRIRKNWEGVPTAEIWAAVQELVRGLEKIEL